MKGGRIRRENGKFSISGHCYVGWLSLSEGLSTDVRGRGRVTEE